MVRTRKSSPPTTSRNLPDHDDDSSSDSDAHHHNSAPHPYPKLAQDIQNCRWKLDRATFVRLLGPTNYRSRGFLRQVLEWADNGKMTMTEVHHAIEETRKLGKGRWPRDGTYSILVLHDTLRELHAKGRETGVRIRCDRPRKRERKAKAGQDEQPPNGKRKQTDDRAGQSAKRTRRDTIARDEENSDSDDGLEIRDEPPSTGNTPTRSRASSVERRRTLPTRPPDLDMEPDDTAIPQVDGGDGAQGFGDSFSGDNQVSASDMAQAMQIFAPTSCRLLDHTMLDDMEENVRLTIEDHHQQAAVPILWQNHWSMAVMDADSRVIHYTDSLPHAEAIPHVRNQLVALADKLFQTGAWKLKHSTSALQQNGHDCGVHAMIAAMNYWYNGNKPLDSFDVSLWRAVLSTATRSFGSPTASSPTNDHAEAQDERYRQLSSLLQTDAHALDKPGLSKLEKSLDALLGTLEADISRLPLKYGKHDYATTSRMLKRALHAAEAHCQALDVQLATQTPLAAAYDALRQTALDQAAAAKDNETAVAQKMAQLASHFRHLGVVTTNSLHAQRSVAGSKTRAIKAASDALARIMHRGSQKVAKLLQVGRRVEEKREEVERLLAKRRKEVWDLWSDFVERSWCDDGVDGGEEEMVVGVGGEKIPHAN
ncbi:hypothetical protein IWX46DRAFT_267942 [Phyllosticta citricarpa]|uniref:Ubiquitin-like protease family profile domain-containing protein n=1 Tax=Phyllosticta citricarpa TaxID=55181 RepID=A0ABR1LMQ9_9PEZI